MGRCAMWTIEQLLEQVSSAGASDLILTVGAPPQLRVLGSLRPVGDERLTAAEAEKLVTGVLNADQMRLLREQRSVDLSRGVPGLSRFRFNIYYQRDSMALAARLIPYRIPGFQELGLPDIVLEFAMRPSGRTCSVRS